MAGNQTIRYDTILISEHGDTMLCDQASQFSQKIWYDTIYMKSYDSQHDAIRLDLQQHPGDTIPYNYVCWKCQKIRYDTIILCKPARRYDTIPSPRENSPDDKIRCALNQRSRYDQIRLKTRQTISYDRRVQAVGDSLCCEADTYDAIRYDTMEGRR